MTTKFDPNSPENRRAIELLKLKQRVGALSQLEKEQAAEAAAMQLVRRSSSEDFPHIGVTARKLIQVHAMYHAIDFVLEHINDPVAILIFIDTLEERNREANKSLREAVDELCAEEKKS